MKDITSRADIESFVNRFYELVRMDSVINSFFTPEQDFDFDHHIPIMCDFWETILLHNQKYSGSPVAKHIDIDKKIKLDRNHFDHWVNHFEQAIDENFIGPVADEAKKRANLMRELMLYKIEYSRNNNLIF